VTKQPFTDDLGNLMQYNGEIFDWKNDDNFLELIKNITLPDIEDEEIKCQDLKEIIDNFDLIKDNDGEQLFNVIFLKLLIFVDFNRDKQVFVHRQNYILYISKTMGKHILP
jgi:hypothetical protein